MPGSESLSVDNNSAVPLYVFTLFLPISRSQKPFLYYIARKKWVIPLLGMICWASPLKVSDLEPGTPQVIAEMLFEKLNLILVAAHNDRRRKCQPASPAGFSKKIILLHNFFIKFVCYHYHSRYASNRRGSIMNANASKNNCTAKRSPAFSVEVTDDA